MRDSEMSAKLKNKIFKFKKNNQGKDYVVGDIHGRFDLVYESLKEINFDIKKDRLFCVGDLIDRGPYSKHVVDFLKLDFVHAIKGNHEDMLLEYYETYPDATDEQFYNIGLQNGMNWFLDNTKEERKEILNVLSELPLVIEIESDRGLIGLIHADIPKNMSWIDFKEEIEKNNKVVIETALWGRNRIMHEVQEDIVGLGRLYVGHTIQNQITKLGNVVALDTGAVFERHLTMVNLICTTQAIINPIAPKNQLFNIKDEGNVPFGKMKR